MKGTQAFSSSFGELLKTYRTRKRLTQQALAILVGVHRNTISIWERGDYLPESKTLVLEVARQLNVTEQETRQLLEASLTALSPHWYLPYARNPFFTGREEVLQALQQALHSKQPLARTQAYALHGLGGIGKTQIALEYAYRHALEYRAVFWIGAETAEDIVSGLQRIAGVLQLPERDDKDQQRVVAAVQGWLSAHGRWLLIWDNMEDLAMLDRFLPSARQGAILITTRRQALGTLARGMNLLPMEHEEGMLFLLRRAKVLEPEAMGKEMQHLAVSMPGEYAAAEELVKAMGGLPLALDQAGAYSEETGCGLSDYLQRYEQQRHQLLDRRGAFAGNHPQSVVATLWLACQWVAQRSPAALEVLRFCACVSPDAIPEELFLAGAAHLGSVLGPVAADPSQFDQAIAVLRSLSLVQRHAETRTLSLHRLVQVVLREGMSEQERAQWQQRAIHTLHALFPEVSHEAWEPCQRLLPHVLTCATTIQDQAGDQELAQVLCKAADYLREHAQYEQAELLYQRALCIGEQTLGAEHPQVAQSLNGLAILYATQGNYGQAESLYQRALRIGEQALGAEHPQVARPIHNLALLYIDQGKYEQAEPLLQRALHIWERIWGPEHPLMAYPLNSLAYLYGELGKYEQAEPLLQRALHLREGALGAEHPQVIDPLNDLATLYLRQGMDNQAEALYQRALRIGEQTLGAEHPLVAQSLNGLAKLYTEQGKHEQAERLYQQALAIREQRLGQHHPETAQTLHDLAILRQKQGDPGEATSLAERALQIRSQSLGEAHPKTVSSRALYAQLVQEQIPAPRKLP